jgi:PBP1b-binding outer membrane lipoprotein LpoB
MKRLISALLILLLAIPLFVGCAKKEEKKPAVKEAEKAVPESVVTEEQEAVPETLEEEEEVPETGE